MVNIRRLHIGQLVEYRGKSWKVCSLSVLLNDPVIHLVPAEDEYDWDAIVEVWYEDFQKLSISV